MKQAPIKTLAHRGYTIKVYQEEQPENPIMNWDMLSSFACWHRRYDLSSKDVQTTSKRKDPAFVFENPDSFESTLVKTKGCVYLPLKLYDHSGITISVGSDAQGFDTMRVGYVFVTHKKLREEYQVKRITAAIEKRALIQLRGDVKTFDQYLTGDIYGFQIEQPDGQVMDSCWGFYGQDGINTIVSEGIDTIDNTIQQNMAKRNTKLKTLIKNKVSIQDRQTILQKVTL